MPVVLAGPSTGRLGATLAMLNGIVLLGYAVLSVLALIHSYVRANPTDRRGQGLNVLLAGLIVGLLPIGASVIAGMFVRVDLLPGADYVHLTLVLIPVSIALALVKGARRAQPSYA